MPIVLGVSNLVDLLCSVGVALRKESPKLYPLGGAAGVEVSIGKA